MCEYCEKGKGICKENSKSAIYDFGDYDTVGI